MDTKINVHKAISHPGRVIWPGKGITVNVEEARALTESHPGHFDLLEPLPELAAADQVERMVPDASDSDVEELELE